MCADAQAPSVCYGLFCVVSSWLVLQRPGTGQESQAWLSQRAAWVLVLAFLHPPLQAAGRAGMEGSRSWVPGADAKRDTI